VSFSTATRYDTNDHDDRYDFSLLSGMRMVLDSDLRRWLQRHLKDYTTGALWLESLKLPPRDVVPAAGNLPPTANL
jgi:hypothetical protein